MRVNWDIKKLGDVCKYDKRQGNHNNLPYVGLEDIESETTRFLGTLKPSSVKSKTFKFDASHVLYGRLRPYLNKVLVPDFEGHCSTEIFPILPTNELDRNYLKYWFISDDVVRKIDSTSTGARMPRANMKEVKYLEIPIPPLPEQKHIVAILDEAFEAIDHVIANVERNIENAEELFQSKLDTFNFNKTKLEEIVEIKTGKLNANEAVEDGDYAFFTCSRETYKIDNYSYDCEAILLAGNNASGDFNVKHYKGKFDAYQRTYIITVIDESDLDYRFLYFQIYNSLKKLKNESIGTATRYLKMSILNNLEVPFPNIQEQKNYVITMDSLLEAKNELISNYNQKLDDLVELKKSLLKKAFSGELTANEIVSI